MARLKNVSKGFRGICLSGEFEAIEFAPGEAKDIELSKAELADALETGWFAEVGDLPQLDHDDDGDPGGSLPHDPPALTGKNKAELIEIAADEGAEVDDDMTNAQIREAIEANRG